MARDRGRAARADTAAPEPRPPPDRCTATHLATAIAVPLVTGGRALGTLYLLGGARDARPRQDAISRC